MANQIGWVEFVCKDSAKTKEFYSSVFGWKFSDFMPGYPVFEIEGGIGGGFRENCPEGTPQTVIYIEVANMDEAIAQVVAAGGTVVVPKFMITEEVGYSAFFKDPNGNVVGLHSRI